MLRVLTTKNQESGRKTEAMKAKKGLTEFKEKASKKEFLTLLSRSHIR